MVDLSTWKEAKELVEREKNLFGVARSVKDMYNVLVGADKYTCPNTVISSSDLEQELVNLTDWSATLSPNE